MIKLSSIEVGMMALAILKYKIGQRGIDLRPNEFAQHITKNAQRIGCEREELLDFYNRYLIPEVLCSCELKAHFQNYEPAEREAKIAYRLLKMGFFWDLRGLRDEVYRIAERVPFKFEEVAAIVTNIAMKHLRDEFGEGEDIKLEINGGFELS